MEAGTEALEVFERHRPRLFGLSYRMLGSVEDAEDLVQEAYLRWHQSDAGEVRSPEAWLVAVTTRMAIDRLRRAAVERERYPGHWLPEPIATDPASLPEQATEQGSDLSVAFLLLLERLGPEERAAFLLREVFDTEYTEIARPIMGADRIAHLMLTVYRKSAGRRTQRLARLNGEPALVVEQDGRVVAALSLETDGERIVACYSVLNPDKLRRL